MPLIVQDILDSKPKIKLLDWLVARPAGTFSVSGLSRACDLPKSTVSMAVADWERTGLVVIRHEGRNKLVQLNKQFYLLPELGRIFSKSRDFHRPLLKRLEGLPALNKRGILAVVVFGSRARGGFTSRSDLDIMVVVEDKESRVAEKAFEDVLKLSEKSGIQHSPIIMDRHDITERIRERDNFIKNVLGEGTVIRGGKWIEHLQATP